MLGFLTGRAPKPKAPVRRPVRLEIERLEARDMPSGGLPVIDSGGSAAPPALTLAVSYNTGKSITLSGQLTNVATVANQEIDITGVATGSTTTDTAGDYTITLTASGLGNVMATEPVSGATAAATLVDAMPMLMSFKAVEGTGDLWTFSGTVTYRTPGIQSVIINLSGAPVSVAGKTISVNSAGTFTTCIQLDGTTDDNGLVNAIAVSPYGTQSNTWSTDVEQT
jgi:hypothetical protein